MTDKKKNAGVPEDVRRLLADAQAQRDSYAGHPDPLPLCEQEPEEDALVLTPDEILEECAALPETDIGNGVRFRTRFGGDVIHVAKNGYFVYDGKRYRADPDEYLLRPLAQRTAEFIDEEALLLDATPEERAAIEAGRVALDDLRELGKKSSTWDAEKLAKFEKLTLLVDAMKEADKGRKSRQSSRHTFAKSSAGSSKLNNMMTEAKPFLGRQMDELNADLHAFNIADGTLRFVRNGDGKWLVRLDQHRRSDLITKMAPVGFDPNAVPRVLEAFLERVQPKAEMRAFLQRFMGYCLLGLTTEHCLLFFYGAGRNGKSTFADLMVDCFGDYAVSMSIDSFAGDQQRKGSEATPDLARLPAVRLIAAEEPEMGVKLRGALIKKMTGGTKMDVRKLNEDFFEFKPHFKLVISGNHKPVIIDDSDGMWARIKMVPWNVQIPDEEKDLTLPDKLRAEMPAVFAWIVRGALDYLENGLRPPAEVTNATEEYRQESDPIGDFLRNGCSVTGEENDRVPVGVAYAAYDIWAKVNGQLELGKNTLQKRFPKKMEQHWPGPDGRVHQFWRIKTNGEFVYAGLKVLGQYLPQDRHPPAPRYADDDPLPEVF